MNIEDFDNDADDSSDEDYSAFVQWLSQVTAEELREAKGNPDQQRQALCRYYKRGDKANLTPSELIDFLGVSRPSILDRAGYDEEDGDAIMHISDSLTYDEILMATLHTEV